MGTILLICWWLLYAFGSNAIAEPTYWSYSCENFGDENVHHNFTKSPSYQSNLIALLSSLISHSTNGFYNTTTPVSKGSLDYPYDITIHGNSFCWGYASTSRCQSCIAMASQYILHNCLYHDYAQIAYDVCMLQYWNDWTWTPSNITIFRDKTSESLDENECRYADAYMRILIAQVPEWNLTFRATEFQISASVKRYGSVQCRYVEGCRQCLMNLIDQFSGICRGWRTWWTRSVLPWSYVYSYFNSTVYYLDVGDCAVKFGDSPFYKLDQSSAPPFPVQRREVAHSNVSRTVIIGIIPSVIVVCLVGCCVNYLWCANRRRKEAAGISANFHDYVQNEDVLNVDIVTIPLRTILHCTSQFSDDFKLGEGGFGHVYKGILPDGRLIAVKVLSETSGQEIISGKRNAQSLLVHAWRLWCEDKSLMLMDSLIEKSCTLREVMKCINIALLCVQEDAADRPTMSMVVLMLGSDEIILPSPNQPPISVVQQSASDKSNNYSTNDVTISNVAPR
ncbi:hypothetical protein L6164_017764 [Bauhinia variegata]|uniref:Uncharacterized protein n=1 Tax=Bauhinia variegata TaxID=167791 RepID=A0ACB9N8Y3_BAUVA|nr:hypothetical protein L6164_017764 [Bauhinia variegata]